MKQIELLLCCICLGQVAIEPTECKSCKTCFCKSHIALLKGSCPKCRKKNTFSEGLPPQLKELVGNLRFKCQYCSEDFNYEARQKHKCPKREKEAVKLLEEEVEGLQKFVNELQGIDKKALREKKKKEAKEKLKEINQKCRELQSRLAFQSYELRTLVDKLQEKIDAIEIERKQGVTKVSDLDLERQVLQLSVSNGGNSGQVYEGSLEQQRKRKKACKIAFAIICSPCLLALSLSCTVLLLLYSPFLLLTWTILKLLRKLGARISKREELLLYGFSPLLLPLLLTSLIATCAPFGLFAFTSYKICKWVGFCNSGYVRHGQLLYSIVFGLWITLFFFVWAPLFPVAEWFLRGIRKLYRFCFNRELSETFEDIYMFLSIIFVPLTIAISAVLLVLAIIFGPLYLIGKKVKNFIEK